jgi:hypothetical protein
MHLILLSQVGIIFETMSLVCLYPQKFEILHENWENNQLFLTICTRQPLTEKHFYVSVVSNIHTYISEK